MNIAIYLAWFLCKIQIEFRVFLWCCCWWWSIEAVLLVKYVYVVCICVYIMYVFIKKKKKRRRTEQ